ncbi:hypothetical protein COT29_00360 [Candidatus Micrarchaeota archaeon CG08_land_8_20_14_0_20_59_11]|nr:MAG: hypothetical protein COT29_00360 [Candidatus Micrarchaeota archaeon CG08_land_8_20_14_0_20_59_11]PIT85159.1 MAG: hypothetical protein COU36_04860 [Candidatus Micrarchaeota archaeon CG10_big_fil_rev_8_21_14_0_10_59_7]
MRAFLKMLMLALMASPCLAYTYYSFSLNATANEDGSAHIVERTVFMLDTDDERREFEYYMGLGKTTLADWQRFSPLVRYHFSGSVTDLKNIASREYSIRYTAASITMEYDVAGLFTTERVGSRITRYSLDTSRLVFSGTSRTGELSLGNNMRFTLELPNDAASVTVVPAPGAEISDHNTIAWNGPISGKWEVHFEREKPLSDEVNEFFMGVYQWLNGAYLWLLVLVFVAVFFLKFFAKKK